MSRKTVGILNEGKHNTFNSYKIEGFDIAIKDKGKYNRWVNGISVGKNFHSPHKMIKDIFIGIIITVIGGLILKVIIG